MDQKTQRYASYSFTAFDHIDICSTFIATFCFWSLSVLLHQRSSHARFQSSLAGGDSRGFLACPSRSHCALQPSSALCKCYRLFHLV